MSNIVLEEIIDTYNSRAIQAGASYSRCRSKVGKVACLRAIRRNLRIAAALAGHLDGAI